MTAIKFRRGTAEEWASIDPILSAGEPGYESDTGKHKVGDGVSNWSSLEYFLPESILATMFVPAGSDPVSAEGLVGVLRDANLSVGADLMEAPNAAAARSVLETITVPAGLKIQGVQNFTSTTGLQRAADPDGVFAIELRGPTNPQAVMLNDDSWVIVE